MIAISVIAVTAANVMAQAAITTPSASNVRFKTIGALGKGIAISSTDPSSFHIIKVGVAKVVLKVGGTDTDVALGILFFDNDKYTLKDVTIGEGTFSGTVVKDNSNVGTISATLKTLGDTPVWYGTLSISGFDYNIYILEGQRKIKASELGEEAKEGCGTNPSACNDVARGIGKRYCDKATDKSCRDKIAEFCTDNPTDPRCVAMFRAFCVNKLDDSRCREELRGFCSTNPTNSNCQRFCSKFPALCGLPSQTTTTSIPPTTTSATTTTATITTITTTTTPTTTTTATTATVATTTTTAS